MLTDDAGYEIRRHIVPMPVKAISIVVTYYGGEYTVEMMPILAILHESKGTEKRTFSYLVHDTEDDEPKHIEETMKGACKAYKTVFPDYATPEEIQEIIALLKHDAKNNFEYFESRRTKQTPAN